jgi:hypothetical protein
MPLERDSDVATAPVIAADVGVFASTKRRDVPKSAMFDGFFSPERSIRLPQPDGESGNCNPRRNLPKKRLSCPAKGERRTRLSGLDLPRPRLILNPLVRAPDQPTPRPAGMTRWKRDRPGSHPRRTGPHFASRFPPCPFHVAATPQRCPCDRQIDLLTAKSNIVFSGSHTMTTTARSQTIRRDNSGTPIGPGLACGIDALCTFRALNVCAVPKSQATETRTD